MTDVWTERILAIGLVLTMVGCVVSAVLVPDSTLWIAVIGPVVTGIFGWLKQSPIPPPETEPAKPLLPPNPL